MIRIRNLFQFGYVDFRFLQAPEHEQAIATACLRLLTFLPPLPECNFPALYSDMIEDMGFPLQGMVAFFFVSLKRKRSDSQNDENIFQW